MGCDLVVALGTATVDGNTLFGHNNGPLAHERHGLALEPGRTFTFGEKVRTTHLELPQVRQTHTVLGCRSAGLWGYH
jgi:hypothetical protein